MTPTLANLERARCQLRPDADGELRGDVEDIAAALDAAELRGHTRAVESTALASIHKAVAAERAAVVAFLRSDLDRLWAAGNDPRMSDAYHALVLGIREAVALRADIIERGEHHEVKP